MTLMNMYASNNIAATFLKQPKRKEMPGDISSNIQKNGRIYYITFNTRQIKWTKISKEIKFLDNIINGVCLLYIYWNP